MSSYTIKDKATETVCKYKNGKLIGILRFKNGKLDGGDLPAIEELCPDNPNCFTKTWMKDGFHHRDNAPAVIRSRGPLFRDMELWYQSNGYKSFFHRVDGPAIIFGTQKTSNELIIDEEKYRSHSDNKYFISCSNGFDIHDLRYKISSGWKTIKEIRNDFASQYYLNGERQRPFMTKNK